MKDKDIIEFTEKKINETFSQKKILNFAAQLAILRRKWLNIQINKQQLSLGYLFDVACKLEIVLSWLLSSFADVLPICIL